MSHVSGRLQALALIGALLTAPGCTFYSNATHWNGRVGPDDKPVHYRTATKIGMRLLIVIPFLGDLAIDGLVDDLTASVAEEKGNHVRIVQGSTENYWYGWPPFTWILTPIVSEVSAEYRPSAETLAKELERQRKEREAAKE